MFRKIAVLTFVVCVPVVLAAQTAEKKTVVKKESATQTNPTDGREMFTSYCAACHGRTGKGDGPAASALTPRPSDLTQFARKHGAKEFPVKDFEDKVSGMGMSPAHGSTEMPVWGPILRHLGNDTLRVYNLRRYIETLQAQ
jgi:mono/diheme cytochrome c family protein